MFRSLKPRFDSAARQVLRPAVSPSAPGPDVLAYGDYEMLFENVCHFDFF